MRRDTNAAWLTCEQKLTFRYSHWISSHIYGGFTWSSGLRSRRMKSNCKLYSRLSSRESSRKPFETCRASPKPTSRRRPCNVTSIPKSSFSLIKAREALKTFPVPFSPSIRLHASRGKSLADYFLKAIKYQTKLFVKWQKREKEKNFGIKLKFWVGWNKSGITDRWLIEKQFVLWSYIISSSGNCRKIQPERLIIWR